MGEKGASTPPVQDLPEQSLPGLSKEGVTNFETLKKETTDDAEKDEKNVFYNNTSFKKIEELIEKMKKDVCTENISADVSLKTYEEMNKFMNVMAKKINDLNRRRNLRIDIDIYLKNIKKDYGDYRNDVYDFLTSQRGTFNSIMDYYKVLKTKQKTWKPSCWECFKKIVAFATDPQFILRRFEVERKKSGKMPIKINTTNLVNKLITYNDGDPILKGELETKVKEYDTKFKNLERFIENNKQKRTTTTSEKNKVNAGENLDKVKQFYEELDAEIQTCLIEINNWISEEIVRMNSPQAQAERLLSGVEGITPEMLQQISAILSSLNPQSPVGDQPAPKIPANPRPDTPQPQQPGPMGDPQRDLEEEQFEAEFKEEMREINEKRSVLAPQAGVQPDSPSPAQFPPPVPARPGDLGPVQPPWKKKRNPFEPATAQLPGPQEEEAQLAADAAAVAEAALDDTGKESDPVQQVLTPTPPSAAAPSKSRPAAKIAGPVQDLAEPALGVDPEEELGTPASADTPTPPPPPPGDSPTGRTVLIPVEPDPEPEQQPPPPQQLNVGLAVPKDDVYG